jgi:predicted GNAT superfamily acetyltransferase
MELRTLTTTDDLRRVYDLELEIWGDESAEDRVSVLVLLVSTRIGGLAIGAFDGERLAGFVFAMPGVRDGKPYQWSHMLGVRPEYRNTGLGIQLKIEQRRHALVSGLDLIAWTYDPLQAMNAHINFAKLGIVAREYQIDAYPGSASPLHAGTATDRFVADWWVRSSRVRERLLAAADRKAPPRETVAAVPVNLVRETGEWLAPAGHDLEVDTEPLAVTIPIGFTEMQRRDPTLAREWRSATREIFASCLRRGYAVTDFILDRPGRRGTYLLTRA